MTDTNQQHDTEKNAKAPTHVAYHVLDTGNGKRFWKRIGSVWAHKDGKGFKIQIDMVPLDGLITLRVAEEKNK
jgi:hypothetical protein